MEKNRNSANEPTNSVTRQYIMLMRILYILEELHQKQKRLNLIALKKILPSMMLW